MLKHKRKYTNTTRKTASASDSKYYLLSVYPSVIWDANLAIA